MIYQPAEDSYFLCEVVSNYLNKLNKSQIAKIKVLDVGTGSGIQAENCIKNKIKKENIAAVDINKEAVNHVKKLGINVIVSDLFSNINKQKYNLIMFNPPYLPEHKFDKQKDTTGGKNGDETIIRFIKKLKSHLITEGICFLLTSSLTPNTQWKKIAKQKSLKIKKLAEKSLFQEKLFVWEIKNK